MSIIVLDSQESFAKYLVFANVGTSTYNENYFDSVLRNIGYIFYFKDYCDYICSLCLF